MAQKAAKQLTARNTSVLNRTHLISLILNTLFLLFRFLLRRPSTPLFSFILYLALITPSLIIEIWFERIGRPKPGRSTGEDLDAKGLTEFLWDVLYWTWGCVVLVALFGDRAWWLWAAVPAYAVYMALGAYRGVRGGMGGLMGGAEGAAGDGAGESKRQKKLEKRGGQRIQYR